MFVDTLYHECEENATVPSVQQSHGHRIDQISTLTAQIFMLTAFQNFIEYVLGNNYKNFNKF